MQIIRLHFTTPLHLGGVRADYDTSERVIHSDTMYAAIFQAWQLLGMEHLIPEKPDQDPGFTLSSLFPFYQEKEGSPAVDFLPKPMIDLLENAPLEKHKALKKVEYVEFNLFRKLFIEGNKGSDLSALARGRFLTGMEIPDDFISTAVYPRVRVPKYGEGGDAKPYYIERIHFRGQSGFYFLADFSTPEIQKAVEAALSFLQDEGLGTDRHVGNGLFRYESKALKWDLPKMGHYCTNLSLFCPDDQGLLQEMMDGDTRFEISRRGGWITTQPYMTYRKKSIHMFREGSVFAKPGTTEPMEGNCFKAGKTVDLRPELPEGMPGVKHPVWRVGRSIFIPVNL